MFANEKRKVYQDVLEQIRQYIDKYSLSPGDKLPSERELSEQLMAGRSSVREALRAMELLGLIETRQGEGTFLREYKPYQTVELLSTFILRESNAKEELLQVKEMLELNGTKEAMAHLQKEDVIELRRIIEMSQDELRHFRFFFKIFQTINNHLLLKIWQLIEDFSRTSSKVIFQKEVYYRLLDGIERRQMEQVNETMKQAYKQRLT
ncbi:FadR/GntR family transcriptional regulator [Salirhabdus salicampi]|uniref:FadR/GntR family transcriptional regulator n=1 Tax=Salirhabdus salicampi TaxID=476102 RepID=UPI0020C35AE6|nr:GntR family transcriptional regulator [Salirhabdus salicampi]